MSKPSSDDVDRWVRELLRRHGVNMTTFGDGSVGLLNVPAKWCAIINDMHGALHAIAHAEELPKFIEPPPKRKRRG